MITINRMLYKFILRIIKWINKRQFLCFDSEDEQRQRSVLEMCQLESPADNRIFQDKGHNKKFLASLKSMELSPDQNRHD